MADLNEFANDDGYGAVWADLPVKFHMTLEARRWSRARTWTAPSGAEGVDLKFERSKAVACVVSLQPHDRLKGWLAGVVKAWGGMQAWARVANSRGEFAVKNRKGDVERRIGSDAAKSVLNKFRDELLAKGFARESTDFVCREAAARSALRVLSGFVRTGRALAVDQTEGLPGAVSVRLALGLNHGRALEGTGAPPWVLFPGVGMVRPIGETWDDVVGTVAANYVEAAHIDQTWRFRFIRVEETKASEKRGKVRVKNEQESV